MKTLRLPCRTTAENMSVEMYGRLKTPVSKYAA